MHTPRHISRIPPWRPALLTMVAMLGSWLSSWGIASAAGLRADVIVLGTVLPVTLSRLVTRQATRSWRERVIRLVAVPLVALVAGEVGVLLSHHRWIGGAVFVTVLAGAVWVRRFGPAISSIGTLVSLPFVVLLVAPVAPAPGHEHTGWPALVGLVALVWVVVVHEIGWATGFVPRPPAIPERRPGAAAHRRARGLPASTRMAVQMGVALAAAYALGTWWFRPHWVWLVLSCYVVCAGNRGRGDVVHKGALRLGGALVGTASATLLASAIATGDRWALLALFAVMAVAIWLRPLSYAVWAAGVTAMLALLHGYYGEHGVGLLGERLAGVALGALIGVAVSWCLMPVRSRDAFRRHWADALAALSELLTALRTDPAGVAEARLGLDHAVAQLEQLEPTWRLHARALGSRPGHPAELVRRLVAVRDALAALPLGMADHETQVCWARLVAAARKRMRAAGASGGGDPASWPSAGVPAVDAVTDAVATLAGEFNREAWLRLGGA